MKTLSLTKPIQDALAELREVQGSFALGRDSMTTIEVAKIRLANVVVTEYEAQRRAQLPKRAAVAAVRPSKLRRQSA